MLPCVAEVRVRVYLVHGAVVAKKKTSVHDLDQGHNDVTFNESMFFNLHSSKLNVGFDFCKTSILFYT